MNPSLFGFPAIFAYLAATVALAQSFRSDYITAPVSTSQRWQILGLAWLAAITHGISLTDMCDRAGNVNFSFLSTSSLASLMIVGTLLVTALNRPVEKLGIIVFPIAILLIGLRLGLPEGTHALKTRAWQMDVHILSSMLAYSFLNIAALQALLVAFQDWQLHSHHTRGWVRSLPPLQRMETLLFQLIGTGFVLLSISLITGFIFIENLFAQHLVHKTVLSLIAWVVFAVVLGGRKLHGWRGKIAIRWTISGFLVLMLAYFGSKIVLELILGRT